MTRPPSVLVAGGGPAGLTVSRLLALRGWPTVVVDPLVPRRRRLELVGPPVIDAFRCAGIEDLLEEAGLARPSLGICRRWGADEVWRFDGFLARRGGRGYVVDRQTLDDALRHRAVEAGVVLAPGRLVGVEATPDGYVGRIACAGAVRHLSADVVIDATGRPSALARRLGARRIRPHLHVAYPREAEALPGDRRAWLNVEGDEADWTYRLEGPGGRVEAWRVEAWRVGDRRAGSPGGVDASTRCIRPVAGPGWIAIGDAAMAFNPIWSEGLSHALGSAITVAGALIAEGAITRKVRDIYTVAVQRRGFGL